VGRWWNTRANEIPRTFQRYRIVVFGGLNCEGIIFDEQVESEKRINLLYDDVKRHYHVIKSYGCDDPKVCMKRL